MEYGIVATSSPATKMRVTPSIQTGSPSPRSLSRTSSVLPFPPGDVVLRDGRRLGRADEAEETAALANMHRHGDREYQGVRVWNGPHRLRVQATHTWFKDLGGRGLHVSASYGSSKREGLHQRPSDKD